MSFRSCCGFLVAMTLAANAQGVEFTLWVGENSRTCDHPTIQAAIDAASANPGVVTTILITGGETYAEDLTIVGKNLRLVGSQSGCGPSLDPLPRPVITGAGGAQRSIINLRGATGEVTFRNLVLHDGDEQTDTDSYGGAVDITEGPHALVYFENTMIASGQAGWGGALSIRNASASRPQDVYVRFGPGNLLFNNRSYSGGGGIYCKDATLDLNGSNNLVVGNYAGDNLGHGGGLYLDDCFVKLASDSAGGVVNHNTAAGSGGGIYVKGDHAIVDIYNIDPDHPTRIKNNEAGGNGGGINIETGSDVRAWDVVIEGNRAHGAGGGVAVYNFHAFREGGHRASFLATSELSGNHLTAPDDAVRCRLREQCNALLDNRAADANDTPRDGAVVRVSSDTGVLDSTGYATASLYSTRIAGHVGRNLMFVRSWNDDAHAVIAMFGAVVSTNEVSDNLVDISGDDGQVDFSQNTLAANSIGGAGVLRFEDAPGARDQSEDNKFYGNIVWQPGKLFFVNTPLQVAARYNVVNEQSRVPAGERSYNLEGYPLFRSQADHDYRLLTGSPALDLARYTVGFTRDGGPRVIDLPSVPNVAGAVDAGAYELDRTNQPPVANRMQTETATNTPVGIVLTGRDADGDPITFQVVEAPQHGSLSGTPPNLTYTPATDFVGVDEFEFVANDGIAASIPATVEIDVSEQPNRPPVADDLSVLTARDMPVNIVLRGSDADGDPITFGTESSPLHGSLSGTAPNLVYTPAAGYSGSDSFTYRALDPTSSGPIATVSIGVLPIPSSDDVFRDGFESFNQ